MVKNWCQAYTQLTDFITANPRIEIGMNIVTIPGDVRPQFYQLFDTLRLAFVDEKFHGLLNKAATLSRSYLKAEKEVIKLLGLDLVSVSRILRRFLLEPRYELIRGLCDPLFDLLKGKVDIEVFEQEVSGTIKATFRKFYKLGYEKWVALSLIKLIEADRILGVSVPDAIKNLEDKDFNNPPYRKGSVLMPQQSKHLSFNLDDKLMTPFIVPDFIVHLAKVDRYVALRSEVGIGFGTAEKDKVSKNREWYPLSAIREKYSSLPQKLDLMVIYLDNKPEDIALIADAQKICRPDLIIECMEQEDWYKREKLEKVKLHHGSLKPKLGTYIVSREPVSEKDLGQLEEGR